MLANFCCCNIFCASSILVPAANLLLAVIFCAGSNYCASSNSVIAANLLLAAVFVLAAFFVPPSNLVIAANIICSNFCSSSNVSAISKFIAGSKIPVNLTVFVLFCFFAAAELLLTWPFLAARDSFYLNVQTSCLFSTF